MEMTCTSEANQPLLVRLSQSHHLQQYVSSSTWRNVNTLGTILHADTTLEREECWINQRQKKYMIADAITCNTGQLGDNSSLMSSLDGLTSLDPLAEYNALQRSGNVECALRTILVCVSNLFSVCFHWYAWINANNIYGDVDTHLS